MSKYINELVEKIEQIKEAGWHETTRVGNTGIGKTFEDLLEKSEDNISSPDFYDIEIKTHEAASSSMLTLFTKSPTYPRNANTLLRTNYGKKDEYGNMILHTTVSGNRRTNSTAYAYDFLITIDERNAAVRLAVFDKQGVLVNDSVYWSFTALEKQIIRKLNTIAIVSAVSKNNNGRKYYKYTHIDIVTGLGISGLIDGIKNGDLKVDIRIGAYHRGPNTGKTHDHGTGFRINTEKLLRYAEVRRI